MSDKQKEAKLFAKNQIIFAEGDYGEQAYVIQQGKVTIFKMDSEGEMVVLGTLGPGAIFGEMALIDDQPRMASARADDTTSVYIVSREMFQNKLENSDPFLRGLLNIFVRHIRNIT